MLARSTSQIIRMNTMRGYIIIDRLHNMQMPIHMIMPAHDPTASDYPAPVFDILIDIWVIMIGIDIDEIQTAGIELSGCIGAHFTHKCDIIGY